LKKMYVIIASLFFVPLSLFAKWDGGEVRIGTEGAYPPWNGTNAAGELEGAEIDMATELCYRMGVKCSFVTQDWDGIIPALLNGKYDVIIAGMSITEERMEKVDFSIGYMTDGACLVVSKDSALASYNSELGSINLNNSDAATSKVVGSVVALLKGKKVGVQGGTIHQNFIEQYASSAQLSTYATQDDLNLDLGAGRIEVGLADCGAFDDYMSKKEGNNLTSISPSMGGGPFGDGVGGAFRKEDGDLREMFNTAIKAALADGTISTIAKKWFGRDISM
jgi:octopine/nopaline transport system substrate-binding protein